MNDEALEADAATDFGPWPGRLLVVLLIAATVPVVLRGFRAEIARWHFAAWKDAEIRGNRAEALQAVNKAVAWDSESPIYQMRKSGALLQLGDTEQAVEVADELLEKTRERVADGGGKNTLISVLNQSAYAHALDNSQLTESLAAIEEAIDLLGDFPAPGVLDTRGYLKYLVATDPSLDIEDFEKETQLEQAIVDMEKAVEQNERMSKKDIRQVRLAARDAVDQAPLRYKCRIIDESRAVLFQHRGLVYQAEGRIDEAEKDFDRAKKLGYAPSKGVW